MTFRGQPHTGSENIHFSAYGVHLGVQAPDSSIAAQIKKQIVRNLRDVIAFREAADKDEKDEISFQVHFKENVFSLTKNGEEIFRDGDIEKVFEVLLGRMRLAVAEHAVEKVFVHAGVVGWKGRAIVAPAQTFHGKTTLIKELVGLGAVYYSDDCAVLDEQGLVHPFPKTLSVRGEIGRLRQVEYPIEHFGGVRGRAPIPVGLILLTQYIEDAVWEPVRLTSGQGVFEMLSHTIPIRYNPEFSLKVLNNAANRAIIVKMKRGDAKTFAVKLLKHFEDQGLTG